MADQTTGQDVDILSAPTGASAIQVNANSAHGATNNQSPVVNGYEAIAHGTNPTAVTAGQVTKGYANRAGTPFVMGGHPNIITKEWQFTASQSNVALITVSTGTKIVVTRCSILNNSATTVNVGVRIGFATATLSAASTSGVAGIVAGHGGLSPGSGVVEGNGGAILGVGADDEDLRITSDVPTSGSLRIIVSYFTIES